MATVGRRGLRTDSWSPPLKLIPLVVAPLRGIHRHPVTAGVPRCQPTLPVITREEEAALAPLGRPTNKLIKQKQY